MSRRAVPVPLILTVLVVPLLWLWAMVEQYGLEEIGYVTAYELSSYLVRGFVIGWVAGLMAGWGARRAEVVMVQWAFTLMAVFAGLNSWGVMFVVVGINSTSGRGIESSYVVMTVLPWLLGFAGFFGTAWLVRWRSGHNSGSSRLRRTP